MTDNEIIKALECCGNIVDSTCKGCAYHETYNASCVVRLMRDALDLINRQKAEIERLKDYNENLLTANTALSNEILDIKTEAIKEFAERFEYFVLHEDPEINDLKCKDYESYMGGVNQFRLQIVKGIDNLVKEMTE